MKTSRIALVAVSSALIVATLSGCSVLQSFAPNVTSDIFASHTDFKNGSTTGFGSPTWLPDDATTIRVDYRNDGSAAILTYTSKGHFASGTCTASTAVPKPPVQDSWWPVTGLPATAVSCPGGWSAFVIGDQVFAAKGAAGS